MRSAAFGLLRLQLLYALLQEINAALSLRALAGQHVALPFLHELPPFLNALFAMLRTGFDPFSARLLRGSPRRTGARGCGDVRLRAPGHGRPLRRGTMDLGAGRDNARGGGA